jgi:hypothetical protein
MNWVASCLLVFGLRLIFPVLFIQPGLTAPSVRSADAFFKIAVVDAGTGRGVPLVELSTVNSIRHWTDSNGLIAFEEPGLMDQDVFFYVHGHGYEYPKDLFDNRGVKLKVTPGGGATIKIKRLNIAERLYRITGEGIYHDSVLLGQRVPLKRPVLNGQVTGQDTVIATPYRGKIYWCWGDTDKPSYPLGNFGASGATSELPSAGGLDPSVGIDLTYFVDKTGFSKPMCPDFGPGLQWIESLITLPDERGVERLLARVASANGLKGTHDWHVAMFNDQKQIFESLVRWDIHDSHDVTTPFRARVETNDYLYLYPNYRVKADLQSLTNRAAYEAFTCLAPPARYEGSASQINRTRDGQLRYQWRGGADRLDGPRMRELIKAGLLTPEESWRQLYDIETGRSIRTDRGSVCWNGYRRRWILITGGLPGEVWFAEADTPVGPWVYARRIISHDHYNFYNPTQHPFFDQDGGRLIYLEGTYTASFSDAKEKTPRYDYNQIMYRLRLDDPRLALPAPVYAVRQIDGATQLMMRDQIEAAGAWERVVSVAFLAVPPDRPNEGLIPCYAAERDAAKTPLFLGISSTDVSSTPSQMEKLRATGIIPLFSYQRVADGSRLYSIQPDRSEAGVVRSPETVCFVWRNPKEGLLLDAAAKPILTRGK